MKWVSRCYMLLLYILVCLSMYDAFSSSLFGLLLLAVFALFLTGILAMFAAPGVLALQYFIEGPLLKLLTAITKNQTLAKELVLVIMHFISVIFIILMIRLSSSGSPHEPNRHDYKMGFP